MPNGPRRRADSEVSRPEWFAAFLADRGTRKPSAHTLNAYRQDFDAITTIIVGSDMDQTAMSLGDITTEHMGGSFAQYGDSRGGLDSAVLVDMERVVHLPVHLGADPREPHAAGWPSQDCQNATEGPAIVFSAGTAGDNRFRIRAASQRLAGARSRIDFDLAARRTARR